MADKKIQESKDIKEEVVDKEIKSTEEVKEIEVKPEKIETKTDDKVINKPIVENIEKTLDIKNKQDTIQRIPDVSITGDVNVWKLLCKASSKSEGWLKSTKIMNVEHGCLVQVSTQQRNPDGSYAVAEALQYVPNIQMNGEGKLDKVIRL